MTGDRPAVTKEEVIAWRAGLGITQAEAADLLPVSLRTLQGWEAGRFTHLPPYLRAAMRDAARRHGERVSPDAPTKGRRP